MCHSIAHHAVSGFSYVHPHVLRACRGAGNGKMEVNLLLADPCPPQLSEIEPLRLALKGLRKKLKSILTAEGFSLSDLSLATLCFAPDPGKDDYCSICHATLKSEDQDPVEYIVNYLGQTVDAQPCGQPDLAPEAAQVRLP